MQDLFQYVPGIEPTSHCPDMPPKHKARHESQSGTWGLDDLKFKHASAEPGCRAACPDTFPGLPVGARVNVSGKLKGHESH